MDDSKNAELSEKSFSIKKLDESLISYKSKDAKNDTYKNSKECKNLNERIIKLFIGNHPLLSIKSIENLARLHFLNKYAKPESYYNSIIIEHIIHNEPGHIVAEFKDFLILGDINEFLQNYYKTKESKYILPKIFEYYINCSVIFPNYVILPESQYIYKNIQKKQKVIDIQQEQEDKEEKIKKGVMKTEKKEDISTTQILDSILNQTDTSGIKQYFGVSTDGNSVGDHLSKIIEGIQYYENNNISDLKPKNHLYKNYEKINLNDSFFKNKIEQPTINGSNKNNEVIQNNNNIKEKVVKEKDLKNTNQFETENNNNFKTSKKQSLVLNKNNINNIIDLSNSIKIINEISLNNMSNKNNINNGFSMKNVISAKKNNSKNKDEFKDTKKKGRNCFGNLIQENTNFYTANNDNGGFNNIVNNTNSSNNKCNTSRHTTKKNKIINNPKKINHKKIVHKNRNVYSSEINIFHSKAIKKSLINSLLNSDKDLEISNKDIKYTNDRGTLTNNKENTKTSLNTNYYADSSTRNRSKKNKIAIRNINVNQNIKNDSEYLYYRNKNNLLFSGLTNIGKNIVYQRKKNSDISSFCNKNKLSNSIKNIKIGFKTKNYSSNNILEYKSNLSASYFSSKIRSKNKDNSKLLNFKKKGNALNNQDKIIKHFNVKSNELFSTKKSLNINEDFSNGNNKINITENEGNKIIFKKENTHRNKKDLIKINSYKYKNINNSTFKMTNSNSKLNTARFINLDKKMEKKSSEKNIRNNCLLNSPKNIKSKRLLLKSDLREKIMNDDNKRPLTMRESLNKKVINNKVIEVLTNKINQIKEYIKESDKKNKNSISHIFRKKKVGRKKILKDNDEIIGMRYGLTEREGNKRSSGKLNLNNEISDQKKKKIIKIEPNIKNNKKIIKKEKIQIKNLDKIKKSSNSKNKKVNKINDNNNKIKTFRHKKNNNSNNYISDINYNINLNNCHLHTKNKSEFYQNTNNNDNISINNNTELGKENKSIILINNNVKIGSLKVFPIKQINQNKIIVKGIKINGFEKLVSKKYETRNIGIPKAVTDRIKNVNGGISQNNSNKYINTSNNNRKQLGKNKMNGSNIFKNL